MSNGNSFLSFDGVQSYAEIADSPDFSVASTGGLTVSAWIRPETLIFPTTEGGDESYVHWLGKGERGQQEWVFRMYSADNKVGRANRISFYVFNLDGGLGIGSHYQDPDNPVQPGTWIHVAGVADGQKTHIYINGLRIESNTYAGKITTQHGGAPLRIGTRDLNSYFQGEIQKVRLWSRALGAPEVSALHDSDVVPADGLVAEYLLVQDVAPDSTRNHDGVIFGATWIRRAASEHQDAAPSR